MRTNFGILSQQQIADYVVANAHDVEKMNELAVYYQSLNSSKNDAGLASSVNSEVQIAPSDKTTVEDLSQMVEVTNPAQIVELTLADEKTNPSETTIVVRKPKTFKPKEVVAVERKFHTIQEVAACYRIGVSTLHKYLKDGLIYGFKMGNQWRFSQSQIDEFENRITSGGK